MSTEQAEATRHGAAGGPNGTADRYYIQAQSPTSDEQRRVLKEGDTFAVFDHFGDVRCGGLGEEGIYHDGTRFLSCLVLGVGGHAPLFLSSTVRHDNELLTVDLTNPDVTAGGRVAVPRGTLHVAREKFLRDGTCHERIRVRNYDLGPAETTLEFHFEADFHDIFEVRGTRPKARGRNLGGKVEGDAAVLTYDGLDGVTRRTRLRFTPPPASLGPADARFDLRLAPRAEAVVELAVTCEKGNGFAPGTDFDTALGAVRERLREVRGGACTLHSPNDPFNDWVGRSVADLAMLTSDTPYGPYPYAGVPWYSTPFGRDGILTALSCLWLEPDLARGVLAYLAATQATAVVPKEDAQPGKILHETRGGEMAATGEVPFGRYYGSVDATPLFVALAGAYYDRTADREFIERLWPHVGAALAWCDRYGDLDGDGFVEYARQTPQGLANQGWKDSHDAILHADGTLAEGPVALVEVQGYVYAAKQAAAGLAAVLGHAGHASALRHEAEELRRRFEEKFWCEELGTYALALDGGKHPCRVRASNPGHCLLAGIVSPERAGRVAATLLGPDSFSGFGVRTLAEGQARYNPMSYHDGSVWPHDNALIAAGLSRYGHGDGALKILGGLFEASLFMDLHRLPELFCGFPRRPGEGPTLYPVACSPQAWSAAAPSLLVQACLGVTVSGPKAQVRFRYPRLPSFLRELQIHNLRVGGASVDLLLRRHGDDVGINVLRREGNVEIGMVK